jgi:hypothetical protein
VNSDSPAANTAAEQIGDASPEQQEAAEQQGVGGDHPLQARWGEVQRVLDPRQGDVHDRDIEDHHELAERDQRESQPLIASHLVLLLNRSSTK